MKQLTGRSGPAGLVGFHWALLSCSEDFDLEVARAPKFSRYEGREELHEAACDFGPSLLARDGPRILEVTAARSARSRRTAPAPATVQRATVMSMWSLTR